MKDAQFWILSPGNSAPPEQASLDTRMYQFAFPADQLKKLQTNGELPLVIHQQ